jgi:hypothetical protein
MRRFNLALFLPVILAACTSPPGSPFDLTTRQSLGDGRVTPLLRVNDPTLAQVSGLALTDDYLLVAVPWFGVYQMPKYGGDVTAVKEARDQFDVLAAGNDILYQHTTFDAQDRPISRWTRRPAVGGPEVALGLGELGTVSINDEPRLRTDGERLFTLRESSPAPDSPWEIVAVPLAGGATTTLVRFEEPHTHPILPTWTLGDDGVYYTDNQSGELRRVAKTGGAPERLAGGLGDWPHVDAVDAAWVYLTNADQVLRVPRAGGAPESLFRAASGEHLLASQLVVDREAIYFAITSDVTRIQRIPLGGGAPVELARFAHEPRDGYDLVRRVSLLLQDEKNLFARLNYGEVVVVSKTPAAAK